MQKIIICLLVCTSCSLFKSEQSISCKDLVVTGEGGPEVNEIRGDPSDQWKISGVENPENVEVICNEGEECEVAIEGYRIYAAYPNPIDEGTNTHLQFSLPEETQLKIILRNSSGSYEEIIAERIYTSGQYLQIINFDALPKGCYKVDYYFKSSKESNAYGLILVE